MTNDQAASVGTRLRCGIGRRSELGNAHATFWNTTLHGLQIASFLAHSRFFDQGPDAHTMERFLGHTVAHPEFFAPKIVTS
jgi:hypothetical protein